MAAFSGLGITDASVEIDGPEVPLLDGGSEPFAIALHPMIVATEQPLPILRIKREVKVTAGKQIASLLPSEDLRGLDMHVSIDFTVRIRVFFVHNRLTIIAFTAYGPTTAGGAVLSAQRRLLPPRGPGAHIHVCSVDRSAAVPGTHTWRLARERTSTGRERLASESAVKVCSGLCACLESKRCVCALASSLSVWSFFC